MTLPRPTGHAAGEAGGVALLTLMGGLLMTGVALVIIASAVDLTVAHARAQSAADAAALAAAATSPLAGGDDEPRVAAQRLADENDATLHEFADDGWPVRVGVTVAVETRTPLVRAISRRARAEATAELASD